MPASYEQVITLTGDLHARQGASQADAKSVLSVMGLGATSGQHITVAAEGPDAEEAVAAILAILAEATRVGA